MTNKFISFVSRANTPPAGVMGASRCNHSSVTLALTVGSPSAHRRGTMLKLLSVLVLILTIGVGNVWGGSWQLVGDDFSGTSYDANAGDHEKDGITYNVSKVMKSNGNIQFQASNGTIYNKTAMLGNITKITANSSVTIKVGTSSNPSSGITVTSGNTISGNYKYFWIKKTNSGATSMSSITVEYADQKYKVTFYNAYGASTPSAVTQTSAGGAVTLPSASPSAACASQNWVFAGWKDGSYQTSDVTSLTGLIAAGSYTPTADKSLYAVFKKTEISSGSVNDSRTFTFSDIADNEGWENSEAYTEVELAPVTIEAQGGGNNGKWYTSSGGSWRAYSGGTISISVANGSVTSVTSSPSCSFTVSNGTASFSPSARTDFTSITVNYTVTGASVTTYNSNPDCCTELASINGSVF